MIVARRAIIVLEGTAVGQAELAQQTRLHEQAERAVYRGSAHLVAGVVQVAAGSSASKCLCEVKIWRTSTRRGSVSFSPRISRNSRNFSTGDSASTTVVSRSTS